MNKDLTEFVAESFDEILFNKMKSMRRGFNIENNEPLCIIPHRKFDQFMSRMFARSGYDAYHSNPKPSVEFMGFILISADVDEIMFAVGI
jgi:hypothetical protein